MYNLFHFYMVVVFILKKTNYFTFIAKNKGKVKFSIIFNQKNL
jgi:hypothetical protein